MEELNDADLKLFFDEEIYLIDEIGANKPLIADTPTQPTVANEPTPKPLSLIYKGNNAKGIAIIINDDSNEFLNNGDETLLLNILKAIGLSLEDVAIINQYKSGIEWQEQLEFTKVIAFGAEASNYNLTAEKYSIHTHQNINWLFSDSLSALDEDKVLKGKLWGKLKELF